jgi:hypothetical protein
MYQKELGPEINPARLPEVNLSQIQEWNKCRYRWDLRYRREIERRSIHGPIETGTAVHAGLAAGIKYYGQHGQPTKAVLRRTDTALITAVHTAMEEAVTKLGGWKRMEPDEIHQAKEIEETSVEVARRTLTFIRLPRWETFWYRDEPLVEQRIWFEHEGFIFHFTPDWVARDIEEGGIWVLDWKIRKSFTPKDAEDVNVQFPAYQYGLERIGLGTTGSIMFQSKSRQESVPRLNQNGSMSRAQIACSWDTYQRYLLEEGLNPDDYIADMKPKLVTEFYREDRVYRNQFVINRFWDHLILPAAREMLSKKRVIHRHMQYMNCQGCWAREFCLAELMDEDTMFLLHSNYVDIKAPAPRVVLRPGDVELIED